MKFLIDAQLGSCILGLSRAFQEMGFSVVCWHPQVKPAFDMFSEFEPDIFLGCPASLTNVAIKKNLDSRPKLKGIVFNNINELLAFDSLTFKLGKTNPQFVADAVHIGRYEPWKLDYIAPLIAAGHTVKIFSGDPWPIPEGLGAIDQSEVCDAHFNACISLCLGTQPQDDYYTAIGCGGLPVSSYSPPMGATYFGNGQINPEGFATECLNILKDREQYAGSKKSGRQQVMIHDTYMRRAAKILNDLNKAG